MAKAKQALPYLWPIVALVVALSAFYFKPWQTKGAETISVTGDGKAEAIPDIAKITATIESKNTDLNKAQSENQNKVSKIVSELQNLAIDPKDIKTQNISGNQNYVQPMIYPLPPRPDINSFGTTLEITVRNFDNTDKVIATLTKDGATNLYGPQLTLSAQKQDITKSRARQNAIDNAKQKAQQLAQASNRKLGKVVKISEAQNFGYPQPLIAEGQADLKQKVSQIQPGQNEVTVTLQIEYSLK